MKIATVFGQLLLSVAEKLKSLSEKVGKEATGTEDKITHEKSKIWGIIDGPFDRDEFSVDDDELPDEWQYMVVAKIEEDGKIGTVNLWFETYQEALQLKGYFDTNIEPLEL
jgi:hypothetical protein